MMRCQTECDVLLSGQLSVGYADTNGWMRDFAKAVADTLRQCNATSLVTALAADDQPAETVQNYAVGAGAAQFAARGGRLRHVTSPTFYLPATRSQPGI